MTPFCSCTFIHRKLYESSETMAQYCIHDLAYRRIGGPGRTLIVVGYRSLPDNVIVAIEEEDFAKFLVNDAMVQDYGNEISIVASPQCSFEKLEFVLARHEVTKKFYRCGFLNDENDERATVYSLDWGFSFVTPKTNIWVKTF